MKSLLIILVVVISTNGKVYERCELAKELLEVHEAPKHQLATWVCIAQHESQFNSSAVGTLNGDESSDHGIFQISDLYWCSPPGHGWACGVTCAQLEDDDIEDDFICAKRIYREHKKLSGDGFNAWAVYAAHCSGKGVQSYIQGCFDEPKESIKKTAESTSTETKGQEKSSTTVSSIISSSTKFSISSSTESPLLNVLTSRSSKENHFRTEPQKPWFQWFRTFQWSQ